MIHLSPSSLKGKTMKSVQMIGITKRFGNLIANNNINFDLEPGEIHALLGENGAGKTTLMRILYGLYRADEGQILINGQPVTILSPKDAIRAGIGMVTQHFTLVPPMTVAENVVLGAVSGFRVEPKKIYRQVAEAAEKYGIPVKAEAVVRYLSVGERQRIEILKALYREARVLIMDEPTAVLVPQEVDALFESLNKLVKQGLSVIFISHKLNEVMAISNRITVLRDGKLTGTVDCRKITEKELAKMMVGRETFGIVRAVEQKAGEPVLTVEDLRLIDERGLHRLKGISFEVRRGEILGIAGVSGNGQAELIQILTGLKKPTGGKVSVNGCDLTGASPSQITAAGMARTPEDRHCGVVSELTVAENLALENIKDYVKLGGLNREGMREHAETLIRDYQIKASPGDRVRTLSGGNIQKLVMARSMSREPACVLAAQPTRGLDVGATEYVRSKLMEQKERGAGVLLISEDLDEIMMLSDRIAVIYEGNFMGIVSVSQANEELLGLMMSGSMPEEMII